MAVSATAPVASAKTSAYARSRIFRWGVWMLALAAVLIAWNAIKGARVAKAENLRTIEGSVIEYRTGTASQRYGETNTRLANVRSRIASGSNRPGMVDISYQLLVLSGLPRRSPADAGEGGSLVTSSNPSAMYEQSLTEFSCRQLALRARSRFPRALQTIFRASQSIFRARQFAPRPCKSVPPPC